MALFVLALVVWPSVAQAQGATVSIDAPAEVGEGVDFTVKVSIGAVENFDSCNFDVSYDPSVIRVTDVTNGLVAGTIIPVDMWALVPQGTQGTIRVIENVPGLSGVSGTGYLAEIHFHVVGSAGSISAIVLSNGVLSDNAANEIPATWLDDSVNVTTALDADFAANRAEGIAGVTQFTFSDATTGGTPGYTYEWDFDSNGSVDSNSPSPTYVYPSTGDFTVSLTVTDSLPGGGTVDVETKVDYITVYASLDVDFAADALEGVAGVTAFTFTDGTTGGKTPYTYAWDFDDNGTVDSTAAAPSYTYASADTYSVSLTVTETLSTQAEETKVGYVSVYDAGDANKDGDVNSLDITKVERIIMTLDAVTPGADANSDGSVNALDITAVELMIMGS
ncbi:MAG: PKD domain-containing protein [Chloroflexota bacterium]|nr:PKD domain-containing protein [Chloroflexota bacterium]